MKSIRSFAAASALLLAVVGATAQTAPPAASGPMTGHAASMDKQVQAMREMHDKMMRARTPQERQALMAEHDKLMQDGMKTMGGMGSGSMGMGSMADRQQMMEKRMEMMQSMMQMMMDRMQMQPPAAK